MPIPSPDSKVHASHSQVPGESDESQFQSQGRIGVKSEMHEASAPDFEESPNQHPAHVANGPGSIVARRVQPAVP